MRSADHRGREGEAQGEPAAATIMLVEDSAPVRAIARRVLERQGYRIREAGDAEHALDMLSGSDEPVDLLITDVVLPGMNGRQLAEALREKRPDLRVLFTSGYTDDALVRREVRDGRQRFLPKPFTPNGLAEAVSQALSD